MSMLRRPTLSGPMAGDPSPTTQRDTDDRADQPRPPDGLVPAATGTGITGGLVLLILGLGLVLIVTAQNTRAVRFEFLWFDGRPSLAVLLLGAILLTLVVDEAIGLVWRRRRRMARRFRADGSEARS